jgi:hypothetical protein
VVHAQSDDGGDAEHLAWSKYRGGDVIAGSAQLEDAHLAGVDEVHGLGRVA